MYALGWTQHSKGSQNIRAMAMLQLILGNIGVRGGGMNALRGHSNIQGLTDIGLMSNLLPGYLTMPNQKEVDFDTYMSTRGFKPLRPNQTSYWQNYKKFFVSFLKSMWGEAATPENDFAYDWLPKLDVPAYDVLRVFELMHQGKMNGYICQGFNPLLSFPNREKMHGGAVEAEVPGHHGSARDRDGRASGRTTASTTTSIPPQIQTEVIQLPSTCFAEDDGLAHQLRPLAAVALGGRHAARRGEDRHLDHGADLSAAEGALRGGGRRRFPSRSSTCAGPMPIPDDPTAEEIAKEINGYALDDADGSDRPDQGAGRGGQAGRRASRSCATTARPPAAAGSIPAASTRTATTWRGGTTPIPTTPASTRNGRSPGRPTAASSTTAPRRT